MIENPSNEEINLVQKGLAKFNSQFPGGDLDIPIPDISLILRNKKGNIVGGVITSMLCGIMHLEVLWLHEDLRGKGLGKILVLNAERMGRKKGYPASQTWTFSFQAPDFYQRIGYEIKGVFEGYCKGVSEYVLSKKLEDDHLESSFDDELNKNGLEIIEDNSKESMYALRNGLKDYIRKTAGDLHKVHPKLSINLILKTEDNKVVGGLSAFATLQAVNFEFIWIDEPFRNKGYGKELIAKAEQLALENGCQSFLAMVYSFQNLQFLKKSGYEIFGFSDNYPDSIKEYYLIKWLK